jgi:hypothetical protein
MSGFKIGDLVRISGKGVVGPGKILGIIVAWMTTDYDNNDEWVSCARVQWTGPTGNRTVVKLSSLELAQNA